MNRLKLLLPICAAIVAPCVTRAKAADIPPPQRYIPYVEVFGGFNTLPGISGSDNSIFNIITPLGPGTVNSNVGEFGGIAVGVALNNHWRVEAELTRSYNSIQNFTFNNGNVNTYRSGAINETYALANVWYDFHNQSAFVPYVGGGLGLGWVNGNLETNFSGFNISATAPAALAFQVGAGVVYDVSDRFSIDLGYRFKAMTGLDPTVTSQPFVPGSYTIDQTSVASHNFQIGAVLHF